MVLIWDEAVLWERTGVALERTGKQDVPTRRLNAEEQEEGSVTLEDPCLRLSLKALGLFGTENMG